MSLKNNKIHLCYIGIEELFQWIKNNNFLNQDFTSEKKKWEREINSKPSFFSDTELVLINQDTLLLKTLNDNQASFLAKTYQLEYQNICQKLFQESKNIILISDRKWKERKDKEKAIVLFKDKESIEKSLVNWLKEMSA